MSEVIAKSEKDFKELKELLEECKKGFISCMLFYKFAPKKGKLEDAKPEEFFSIWYPFCDDYKNIWKKEQVTRMFFFVRRIGLGSFRNSLLLRIAEISPGILVFLFFPVAVLRIQIRNRIRNLLNCRNQCF
jgi:hypothetical protein